MLLQGFTQKVWWTTLSKHVKPWGGTCSFSMFKKSKIAAQYWIKNLKTFLWNSSKFPVNRWRTALMLSFLDKKRPWEKWGSPLAYEVIASHTITSLPLVSVAEHLAPVPADPESHRSDGHLEPLFWSPRNTWTAKCQKHIICAQSSANFFPVTYLFGNTISKMMVVVENFKRSDEIGTPVMGEK